MKNSTKLMKYVQQFFQDYLAIQRGLSTNTVFAYRDALKLFLIFVANHNNTSTVKLDLDDLTADTL